MANFERECMPLRAGGRSAHSDMRRGAGRCVLAVTGKTISCWACTQPAEAEREAMVTVVLLARENGVWREIAHGSETAQGGSPALACCTAEVEGGRYYKAVGVYVSRYAASEERSTSSTREVWLP